LTYDQTEGPLSYRLQVDRTEVTPQVRRHKTERLPDFVAEMSTRLNVVDVNVYKMTYNILQHQCL